jgi:Domain of unknown function (DUF4269)
MIDYTNIAYLQNGNYRQQKAYEILTGNQILSKIIQFEPILVGTIPINIDIENSDLDIICCFEDKQAFVQSIIDNFGSKRSFEINEQIISSELSIVANFFVNDFEIEIFGQSIPTKHQMAYRHLIVEHYLLNKYGENVRKKIIELKRQGQKTEPAFATALGLKGDPYAELLKFENMLNK